MNFNVPKYIWLRSILGSPPVGHVVQAGPFIGCRWSWNSWNWDLPKPGHPPWWTSNWWRFSSGCLVLVSSGTSPQARHFIQAGLSSVTSILVWTPIDGGSAISVGEAGTTIDSGSLVSSGTAPTSGAVEDSEINKWGISSTLTSNSIEVGSAGGVGGVGTTRCWGTGKLKPLCSGVETGSSTAGDRWAGTSGLRGRNSSQIFPAATSTISLGSTEAMVSIPSRGTLCQERLDHVIAGGVGDNDSGNSRFIKITF